MESDKIIVGNTSRQKTFNDDGEPDEQFADGTSAYETIVTGHLIGKETVDADRGPSDALCRWYSCAT